MMRKSRVFFIRRRCFASLVSVMATVMVSAMAVGGRCGRPGEDIIEWPLAGSRLETESR